MRKSKFRASLLACAAMIPLMAVATTPTQAAKAVTPQSLVLGQNDANTRTPIKHVIIIVGENRSYDHLFATHVPPIGATMNLLSEGIINADGSAGPNVSLAAQTWGEDTTTFSISPDIKGPYKTLPAPTTGFVH